MEATIEFLRSNKVYIQIIRSPRRNGEIFKKQIVLKSTFTRYSRYYELEDPQQRGEEERGDEEEDLRAENSRRSAHAERVSRGWRSAETRRSSSSSLKGFLVWEN